MGTAKIKTGDEVIVLTGKDKGKSGIVIGVTGDYVKVEGINIVTKCIKRNPNENQEGGFKKMEVALHKSKLIYSKDKKPVKLGIKKLPDGKKVRYNKRTNEQVDT